MFILASIYSSLSSLHLKQLENIKKLKSLQDSFVDKANMILEIAIEKDKEKVKARFKIKICIRCLMYIVFSNYR